MAVVKDVNLSRYVRIQYIYMYIYVYIYMYLYIYLYVYSHCLKILNA